MTVGCGRRVGRQHHAEAGEGGARDVVPADMLQKARGLGQERTQEHQDQPGRQVQEPHDPPAEVRLQQRREGAGGEESADCTEATDQHEAPAAVPGRHDFSKQRVGHRQHAAGRGTHHETHADVPPETRHRTADRGAYEHHRGQHDGCAAPIDIGERAPHEGADHRPKQRRKRQPGDGL